MAEAGTHEHDNPAVHTVVAQALAAAGETPGDR
jgi:hypothetical protein